MPSNLKSDVLLPPAAADFGSEAGTPKTEENSTVSFRGSSSHSNDESAVEIAVTIENSARIQTLRGLACLLLIAFHAIGHNETSGLRVAADSGYRLFTNIFIHLRMPLFAFLSGFLYACRPIRRGQVGVFLQKKTRRLLIPLLAASTIHFVLQRLNPSTHDKIAWHDIWRIYVSPYDHFWFLQALILLFAGTVLLDSARFIDSFGRFMMVFVLSLLVHLVIVSPYNVFSINGAVYLLPFFLAGIGIRRFRDELCSQIVRYGALAIFGVTMTAYVFLCLTGGDLPGRGTAWGTTIGLSGCVALLNVMPRIRWMAWVGGFSFTIYLYHGMLVTGTRVLLGSFGIASLSIHIAAGIFAGIAGAIFLEIMLRDQPSMRRVLLGH